MVASLVEPLVITSTKRRPWIVKLIFLKIHVAVIRVAVSGMCVWGDVDA